MIDSKIEKIRFVPVHVINPRTEIEESISIGEELESLITTLGGEIVGRITQRLNKPDLRTFVGKGKVLEISDEIKKSNAQVVVLNATAKPGQVFNLKKELQKENPEIEVWDRVDLILRIFEKHANTSEAKLQIELARMRYMGPRIYGMGMVMSRQGGGIGTVGVGETNTELMKRHWRHEMKNVTDELDKLTNERERQIERRHEQGYKTVSIVGYTNAGKTSLFNLITKKNNLVEDALFATLDSSVGRVYLPKFGEEVLMTDTIGFIRNLPPKLVDAFKSTLLESIHADVLLHVIDVSDPEMEFKINTVNQILSDIGRTSDRIIYVFNKVDKVDNLNRRVIDVTYSNHYPLFISTKSGEGIEEIKEVIADNLL